MQNLLYFFVACCILSGLGACHKAVYSNSGDAVFITGTETNHATSLSVDTTASSTAISITASALTGTDVTARLKIDTGLIAGYNTANGKSYVAPPAGSYSLAGDKVTIISGKNVSDAVDLTINSSRDLKDGVAYMVPVTISNITGGLRVLESSRTVYVIVNKVIRATVASITGNYFTCDFSQNNTGLKAMTAISYEARVLVNSFQSGSPFISSLMGIEENYLLRFGDVTISKDQLQQAGGGALTVAAPFATNTWYHVALTYDGSTQKIYVNGIVAASRSLSRTVDLTSTYSGGFHIGYSAGGRLLNGQISECRVWSRALSQTEIIDGMCGVDPKSSGLVAYWKLNEGTGNTSYDLSGNHHDAVAAGSVTWIPAVRCN